VRQGSPDQVAIVDTGSAANTNGSISREATYQEGWACPEYEIIRLVRPIVSVSIDPDTGLH